MPVRLACYAANEIKDSEVHQWCYLPEIMINNSGRPNAASFNTEPQR